MASLHTGSLSQSVELLRIETNQFNLYIQGKPFHPTVETLQLHRTESGERVAAGLHATALTADVSIKSISVFSPSLGTLTAWQPEEESHPIFFETQAYELVIEKKQDMDLVFHHDHVSLRQAVKPLGKMILSGILNFQNEVGLTELVLKLNGQAIFQLQLEIFPSKMDYKKDYQMILHDVNQQIYNLSFDFLRKTYHLTGLKETRNQSLTEFFTILQHLFNQLVQAVERIQSAPHSKLNVEKRVVDAARARKASKENIAFLTKRPHFLVRDEKLGFIYRNDQRFLPSHVLETKRQVDYDTMENRFVRWVLVRISQKLVDLKARLSEKGRLQDPLLLKRLDLMQSHFRRLLKLDFLNVGEMKQLSISLVLQMAPGYREVYRNYLMLMKGLSIQSDLFRLSMKDLAQLYEYWCFLKIHDLLSRKYELLKQDIIKINRTGVFVTLDRTQKAKMVYRNPKNGELFTLYYNALPKGDQSPTLAQRPDNVLTLKKNDSSAEYKYIFDAKYRMNPAYEGTYYYEKYKMPGPEEDDINTMHRYRDAIVYMDGQHREFERSMFGAYVLFPYHDEAQFREHRFYKSIELINIGAFPFLPNSTELMEAFLDEIIQDSPEKAYERSTQPRGTKDYYRNKMTCKNVAVGSLREASQLAAALEYGFYHVPLENISDHKLLTQLEYVALYQSRSQFQSTGEMGIHWYGKVADWEVVRRKEITEIPARKGTEEKLYVKFTVEQWTKRDKPIVSGGRGIYTLLYTSKYMFDRAAEIAELKLETDEDLMKWREQRRIGQVKVNLNHEQVDLASKVLGIDFMET
ncbi:restriction endonuclease-like protein [Paenibacillus spongiae]|uniref:Restriction endonuclease-like protein n=1 Tax=Paenibacillus spongiae TaxID=2909671 RepID=A0ABY5SBW1_9BACL|nr:restriction endonuclease-like protein [Paenibacillus spongiae]